MDENINKLVELFNSKVKNIEYTQTSTVVEFENGQIVPLYGGAFELPIEVKTCSFCENISEEPLFTMNDKHFICKKCVALAIKTFLDNGINVDLELGDVFKDLVKQVEKINENLDSIYKEPDK